MRWHSNVPAPLAELRIEDMVGSSRAKEKLIPMANDALNIFVMGPNYLIKDGTRQDRINTLAGFANTVASQHNVLNNPGSGRKSPPEFKCDRENCQLHPFTVKYVTINDLNRKWSEIDKASKSFDFDGEDFADWSAKPDFIFISEFGEEYLTAFKIAILQDLLNVRYQLQLPVIISMAKRLKDLQPSEKPMIGEYIALREILEQEFELISLGRPQ